LFQYKELGFELFRLTDHPQKALLSYVKLIRGGREIAQKAFYYCNDSFRTSICVHYPPQIVAVACIYLAIRTSEYPMPKLCWWVIMETSIKYILEVCAEIMRLYEKPKMLFKDANEILDKFRNTTVLNGAHILIEVEPEKK